MTITTETPLRKLARLKELEAILRHESASLMSTENRKGLETERDAILASVGTPPLELIGVASAKAWGDAMAAALPVDAETAEHWFANAMLAAADDAHRGGYEQGLNAGRIVGLKGVKEAVDTLRLIKRGLESNAIHAGRMTDKATGQPTTLGALVTNALNSCGVTE